MSSSGRHEGKTVARALLDAFLAHDVGVMTADGVFVTGILQVYDDESLSLRHLPVAGFASEQDWLLYRHAIILVRPHI